MSRAFHDAEHRSDFARRAAGVLQELQQFVGRAAFKALGDVVRDGQRRALELIGQVPFAAERRMLDSVENRRGQIRGSLPDGRVFEVGVGHRVPPFEDEDGRWDRADFRFEISDLRSQVWDFRLYWRRPSVEGGDWNGKSEIWDLRFQI
jgi:hypothetical protein